MKCLVSVSSASTSICCIENSFEPQNAALWTPWTVTYSPLICLNTSDLLCWYGEGPFDLIKSAAEHIVYGSLCSIQLGGYWVAATMDQGHCLFPKYLTGCDHVVLHLFFLKDFDCEYQWGVQEKDPLRNVNWSNVFLLTCTFHICNIHYVISVHSVAEGFVHSFFFKYCVF